MNRTTFPLNISFKCRFIITLLICTFCSWNLAVAQEHPTRGKVRLATGEGYSPFVSKDLPEGGWSASLVKKVFNEITLDTEIEVLPWNRALKWTLDGKFLGAFPFVFSKSRAEKFLFSEPINHVPVHMYVAKNSIFSHPDQLRGKRLCFPFSYSLDSVEREIVARFEMTINIAKDGIGCVRHVNKGWSDAGLTNGYIQPSKLELGEEKEESIVIFPERLALIPLHFVISKDYINAHQWIVEFNHAFSKIQRNGEKSRVDNLFLNLIGQR